MQPRIIAVSAIAGGGKSTLVNRLVETLDDAVGIYFDPTFRTEKWGFENKTV